MKLFRESGVLIGIMKKILFALFAFASVVLFASDSPGEIAKKLYGRIQFVSHHADYNVCIVENPDFADLAVKVVEKYPDRPGEWQIVSSNADFKICIVEEVPLPDLRVVFVELYSGPLR